MASSAAHPAREQTNSSAAPARQQFEQRLRERRMALRMEIRAALLREDNERHADIAGQLQDTQDHALAALLADVTCADVVRDAQEINDIEGALGRMAAGTYGTCTQCEASIPHARLDAYPTAKRCLPCQQAHEKSGRAEPSRLE